VRKLALLLPFVVVSFAANSLITSRGAGDAHRVRPRHRRGRAAAAGVRRGGRAGRGPTLAVAAGGIVTVLGVVLLALTGISWGLLIPIRTAAGAVALLGEPLSAALFVAAGLVAAGMWPARPPSPAAPQRG
jgi:hypothetical protein